MAPTQIEFIANEKYKNVSSSQKATLEYTFKNLNPGITPVNVYDVFKENSGKYLLAEQTTIGQATGGVLRLHGAHECGGNKSRAARTI